jgi:hypothetical protein
MYKEDPNVAAVPATRPLENGWHAQLPACVEKGARVVSPCLLMEIHGEKPADFVRERTDKQGQIPNWKT